MKILHVIGALGEKTGGAAIACLELCTALAARGHEVEIFTTNMDRPTGWKLDAGGKYVNRGVTVHFFPWSGPQSYWVSPKLALALFTRLGEFDIVEVHSLYRSHLPLTAWFCKWHRIPYVVKPHGSLAPFLYQHNRSRKVLHEILFDRLAYRGAAAIHYGAEEEQRLAESTGFFGGSNHTKLSSPYAMVIAEATNIQPAYSEEAILTAKASLASRFPELAGKVIVLFLGRLNFKKGIDLLVEAFAKIHREIPNAHLLFVGPDTDGYRVKIETWVAEQKLQQQTTFTGMLTGADKIAAFRMASVFTLPSYTENFGIAIIEAMVEGCPVVISNKVNIWREIENADAGLVVDCNSTQTASAIMQVIRENSLRESLIRNGKKLAAEHYAWPAVAHSIERAYLQILARDVKAAPVPRA